MTFEELAEVVSDSIKEDGIDGNEFAVTIKNLLRAKGDFYKEVPNIDRFKFFKEIVDNGDVDLPTDEDYKPLTSESYWGQPDKQSFIYVARILPAIRQKYPKLYRKIFNGTDITMPAGLDDASKKDQNKVTIWNEVEKSDESAISGREPGGNSFRRMNNAEKGRVITDMVKSMEDSGRLTSAEAKSITDSSAKLRAVSEIILKFLQ